MKNNFITKIIGATLAFAMMIGGAVGVATSSKSAKPVYATSTTATIAFGNTSGHTALTHNTTSVSDSEGNSWAFSVTGAGGKSSYQNNVPQLGNSSNKPSAASFTWTLTESYKITAMSFGVSSGSSNGSGSVAFKIDGTAYNASPNTYSGASQTTISRDSLSVNIASGKKVAFEIANSNGSLRIYSLSVTYETVSSGEIPTVQSVALTGEMTKKTYNTVESWDHSGLAASVTMSDNSDFAGELEWTYNPETPAAAVISNNNEEVTDLSVNTTVSADNHDANKSTSGIAVNYATVAQLTSATPATGQLENIIVKGIISQINEVSTQHGNATYFISDDGTTTNQYEIYRGKGLNQASFTNVNDIQVGDIVVIYGNATTYNSTKELAQGNYLLSLERPASTEPSITIVNTDFTFKVGDANVEVTANAENIPEGGSVAWESSNTSVATIVQTNQTFSVHAVAAGTATITAKILNVGGETVASNTIEVAVLEQLLEDGDSFIIKATRDEHTYYLTGVSASNYGTISEESSDAMIFMAIEGETAGQFQFKNGDNKFLSYSGSSNAVYVTDNEEADSTFWTAIYDGNGTIVESVKVAGRKLRYNNGDSRFACYTTTQTAIDIEKVAAIAVNSVSASLADKTYYENTQLTASDFTVTVTWTGGKSNTQPTSGFTWTVNGVENGTLSNGSNTVVVTYGGESSDPINVSAQAQSARMYLNNTEKVFSISGEEESSGTPDTDVDFNLSAQGFSNNTGVNGSYPMDSNVTLTLSNGCKYFDSGAAVRIYASNSFTITSSITLKSITFTWDGSDKPASNNTTVSAGTYDYTNNIWTGNATSVTFTRGSGSGHWRLKTISATYGNATVTVDHVELRFGASIPQTDWTSINSNWTINDYGVMFMKKATLQNNYQGKSIAEAYTDDGLRPSANVHKGSGETPYAEGDNYMFAARIRMTDVNNYDVVYVAAPYIVAGGEYFFLEEMEYSVNTLAQYCRTNGGSDLSSAALNILSGN